MTVAGDIEGMVLRVARGERKAFEDLYRATSPRLYGVILHVLQERAPAQEVLQEVYLDVWNGGAEAVAADGIGPIPWLTSKARDRSMAKLRQTLWAEMNGHDGLDVLIESENLESAALAAGYAMGGLHGEAQAEAALRLKIDPAFEDAVTAWQDRFAVRSEDVAPVAPPRRAFKTIRREVFGEAGGSVLEQLGVPFAVLGSAAAALTLYVSLSLGVVTHPEDNVPILMTRMMGKDDTPIVVAAVTDDGMLYVEHRIDNGGADQVLELWLMSGQGAPRSLGVLAPDQTLDTFAIPEPLVEAFAGAILSITNEPSGGSPSGKPTGAVLASGRMTAP